MGWASEIILQLFYFSKQEISRDKKFQMFRVEHVLFLWKIYRYRNHITNKENMAKSRKYIYQVIQQRSINWTL